MLYTCPKYGWYCLVVHERLCAMVRRYSSSVSPKGQITLPIEIRRELDIDPKDRVDIEMDNGAIRVIPRRFTVHTAGGVAPRSDFRYVEGETERMVKDDRAVELVEKLRRS